LERGSHNGGCRAELASAEEAPSERRPLSSLLRFKERMQNPDRKSRQWAEGAQQE
jgi:hypothetical protein